MFTSEGTVSWTEGAAVQKPAVGAFWVRGAGQRPAERWERGAGVEGEREKMQLRGMSQDLAACYKDTGSTLQG